VTRFVGTLSLLGLGCACSTILDFERHRLESEPGVLGGAGNDAGASGQTGGEETRAGTSDGGHGNGTGGVAGATFGGAPSNKGGDTATVAGAGGEPSGSGNGGAGGVPPGNAGEAGAAGSDGSSWDWCVPEDGDPGMHPPIFAPSCPDGDPSHCESLWVPGGRFRVRDNYPFLYELEQDEFRGCITVSGFYLDRFEVTVARFRRFVEAYDDWHAVRGNPAQGSGTNPNVDFTSWQTTWNPSLPESAAELRARVSGGGHSWTDIPEERETLPITHIDWFVAQAFCIWDGGRLPTEMEWAFAAGGGSEERTFAWGDAAPTEELVLQSGVLPLPVGSKPAGEARWGHLDVTGSMYEWTFDYLDAYPREATDYAKSRWDDALRDPERTYHGGSFFAQDQLENYKRGGEPPTEVKLHIGVRCARDPAKP